MPNTVQQAVAQDIKDNLDSIKQWLSDKYLRIGGQSVRGFTLPIRIKQPSHLFWKENINPLPMDEYLELCFIPRKIGMYRFSHQFVDYNPLTETWAAIHKNTFIWYWLAQDQFGNIIIGDQDWEEESFTLCHCEEIMSHEKQLARTAYKLGLATKRLELEPENWCLQHYVNGLQLTIEAIQEDMEIVNAKLKSELNSTDYTC